MAGIKDYSTTAANNTSVGGISIAEGMLPSNINDAFRAVAADTREWYNDAQWVIYGDGDGAHTFAYASGTSFTVAGVDVTGFYHAGRRIKAVGSSTGTIFGTIASSSFSTNTTVNVTFDSGSLSNETLVIYVAILSKTNNSIPTDVIATANIQDSAINNAKISSSAAIDATKIHDGTISNTEFGHLNNVSSNIQTQLDSKLTGTGGAVSTVVSSNLTADRAVISNGSGKIAASDVTSTEIGYLDGVSSAIQTQLDGKQATLTGSGSTIASSSLTANRAVISNGSQKIAVSDVTSTELGHLDGVSSNVQTQLDAKASTTYVNDAVAGLRTRIIAEVATTANVDLSADLQNGDTIDGVTLVTGDRVLVKDQSTGSENGLYTVVASGTASRDTQFDSIEELSGQMVVVNQGTTNDNKIFLCTTNNTASLGSDTITFSVITPSNVGTVTSVGIADAGAGEFTVGSSPVTSSGNITLAINSIADSKLATISTAGKVDIGALEIDGATDIGANLASTDLIIVDDGANGTERKCALSRVSTFIENEGFSKDDPTALAIALG